MSNYFCRRYKRFDGDISVKGDLLNYPTKTDLKMYHMLMSAALH